MKPHDPANPGGADALRPTVEELADALSAVVRDVPGVVRLHAGVLGEIGTYLPGRRVAGVRVRGDVLGGDGGVDLHVVVSTAAGVRRTAQDVHAAAEHLLRTVGVPVPVVVHVEDVAA